MAAIDDLTVRVLSGLGMSLEPPIDMDVLAQRLGVSEIVEARLVEDGRLERARNRTRILVRRGVNSGRRRFTIAHELAHLLLADDAGDLIAHRARLAIAREERFCDQFAAALLIPSHWLRLRYCQRPRRLAVVRDLTDRAKSSMASSVVRLDEVLSWGLSLLRWRNDQERWRLVAGAAIPPSLHGEIGTAPETSRLLDEVASRTTRDVRLTLPLLIRDRLSRVAAEVSVRYGSALALATLSAPSSQS